MGRCDTLSLSYQYIARLWKGRFMTNRRSFITGLGISASAARGAPQEEPDSGRQYWLRQLTRLADPVLRHLAAGTLKRNLPVECATGNPA